MERISTIQTASVITQPVDATKRLTLIEKLEREYQKWCELEDKSEFGSGEAIDARGRTRGLLSAIEVVKQHSDWISVDERLPEPNKIVLVAIHYPQYYVPDFMYVTTADYDEVRKNGQA